MKIKQYSEVRARSEVGTSYPIEAGMKINLYKNLRSIFVD